MNMNKIAIIGCGGAGKSTFSRKLSKTLNIPLYHLDASFWKPGWIQTPKDEWEHFITNLVCEKQWIIDGNYGRTLDIRLKSADTIIFLNMPTYICLYRIIKRRFMYHNKSRPDMNEGCPEKLDLEFIKWVWNYKRNRAPEILEKLNKISSEKNIIIFNTPSEVNKFIANCRN